MALKITKDNFSEVLKSDKTVVIDFWATWCGPCQMMAPVVEEIAAENEHLLVGKVDVDEEPALAQQFSIVSIPTLVVIKDGKEIKRIVGFRKKEQVLAEIN